MPNYRFDIESGEGNTHQHMIELPNAEAARTEIERVCSILVKDGGSTLWQNGYVLTVTDDQEVRLFRIVVVGLEASAKP